MVDPDKGHQADQPAANTLAQPGQHLRPVTLAAEDGLDALDRVCCVLHGEYFGQDADAYLGRGVAYEPESDGLAYAPHPRSINASIFLTPSEASSA